jgi:hypothetical protein
MRLLTNTNAALLKFRIRAGIYLRLLSFQYILLLAHFGVPFFPFLVAISIFLVAIIII